MSSVRPLRQAWIAYIVISAWACVLVFAPPVAAEGSGEAVALDEFMDAMQTGEPMTPSDLFNAGLGFAHRLDAGRAVLAMERAQLLLPLDREIFDTRQRIQTAARTAHAERTGGQRFHVGEPPSIGLWRAFRSFPLGWAQCLMIIGSWVTAAAAFHALWRPSIPAPQRLTRWAVGLVAGACALAGGFLWVGHTMFTSSVQPHVVIASAPACRDAPDELARTRRHPDMYSGAVVQALEFRTPWIRVELAGGETVWVEQADLAPIEPVESMHR
jgi:hypothetical protein